MAPTKGLVNVRGWVTPSNLMISFRSSILGVLYNSCEIYSNLHLS
jgi:hypothetical protein